MKGGEKIKRFLGWVYGFVTAVFVLSASSVAFAGTMPSPDYYGYMPTSISYSPITGSYPISLGGGVNGDTNYYDMVAGWNTPFVQTGDQLVINASGTTDANAVVYLWAESSDNSTVYRSAISYNADSSGRWNIVNGVIPVPSGVSVKYVVMQVGSGNVSFKTFGVVSTSSLPDAPTGLLASNVSDSSALLSWSASIGATSYNVYNSYTGVLIASGLTSTSYTWKGLSSNTSYSFTVTGVNATGEGSHSSVASFTTFGVPVVAPSGLTLSGVTTDSVVASWQPLSGVTGYAVYVDGTKKFTITGTSLVVSGLSSGLSHSVAVAGINKYGIGLVSSSASVTTNFLPVPTGLVSSVSNGSITLTWQPVTGVSSYKIYENGTELVSTSNTTYTVTGLTNGTSYSFAVSSVDAFGNVSAQSSVVSGIPHPPPFPINGLAFSSYGRGVRIVWGGTEAPFSGVVTDSTGKVLDTFNTGLSGTVVSGLTPNTIYHVSVTDSGANNVSSNFSSGSGNSFVPPLLPDSTGTYNAMGGLFHHAGVLALYVIGGALALGSLVIVLVYGWRLLRGWLSRSKSFNDNHAELMRLSSESVRSGKTKL